jgi:hypothetical protein
LLRSEGRVLWVPTASSPAASLLSTPFPLPANEDYMYHVPQALYGHARQLLPAPTDWASYVLHDSLHFHYLSNLTGEQRSHAVDFAFEMLQAHPVFLIAARRRREESEAIIESASQPGQLGIVALWEGKIFGLAVFRRRSAYGRPVTILESYSSEFHAQLKRREDQLAELADLGPDLGMWSFDAQRHC